MQYIEGGCNGNEKLRKGPFATRHRRLQFMKPTVTTLTVIATLALSSNGSYAASEKVLCLTIDGDLLDTAEILLCNKGLKVRNRLGLVCWSPEKPSIVYMANSENHTYFAQPAGDYLKDLREDYPPLKYTRLERKPKTLPDGTKAEMVTAFWSSPKGQEMKVAEITCLKNTGIPPAVNRMWCAFLGVPEKDFSLPIGAFQNASKVWRPEEAYRGGRKRWIVVALPKKVVRKTMDEKLLKLPSNYREAKDKASLYLSSDGNLNQKDLEDFFISPKK